VISGFRRYVDEICAPVEYYAAASGIPFPTFRDCIGPIFKGQEVQEEKTLEDGSDTLPRNVGEGSSLDAA
jgi:hypothetical protein